MTNELKRPLDSIASSVDRLGTSISDSSAIQAVDLLTDAEIDELRELIRLGDAGGGYAASRLGDEAVAGMYLQLSQLGFVECAREFGGGLVYLGHSQKANWAVARHDLLEEERKRQKAEAERARKEDRKHDRINMLIGWLFGLATAMLSALFTEAIDLLLLPQC